MKEPLENPRGEARKWLRENGYVEVADKIDSILSDWKKKGLKTRRNWWEILAGDLKGKPRIVAGYKFPVIAAARRRQKLPKVDTAIVSPEEKPSRLRKWNTGRWKRRRRKFRHRSKN